jgi:hypothetical protein
VDEFPHLRAAGSRLKGKPFEIVWVSLDDTKEALAEVVKKSKLPGIHTWDQSARENPIAKRYNVRSLPTWYVIDQNGRIAARDPFEQKLVPSLQSALHADARARGSD